MARTHNRALAWAGGAGLAAGAAAYWLPAAALVSARARRLFRVHATVPGPRIVLTFDDGPHLQGTPACLAALDRLGLPAVFFLVGEQVQRYPTLAAEIAAAGHQIGLHCHRHRNLMRLTPRQTRDDLARAVYLIAEATGSEPRHYRPPYGILTTAALASARNLGCEVVLWRRDGHDWEGDATAGSISRRILRALAPGDVVLLHDADHYSAAGSWRHTLAALDPIAAGLEQRRLHAAPLP